MLSTAARAARRRRAAGRRRSIDVPGEGGADVAGRERRVHRLIGAAADAVGQHHLARSSISRRRRPGRRKK